MKPHHRMSDRELLLALIGDKPGCTVDYLLERFNETRIVERPRMKTIISTAKVAGQIQSGRTKGLNQYGVRSSLATYWLADAKVEKVPEVARPERPSISDAILPCDRRPGRPDLPQINRYGYVRGTARRYTKQR